MIKKIDLGAVSAYALAVEKGYEGTEEEFTEILTNALNYATQAQESASAAAGSAEEAGNYKTQAREILTSVNLAGTQQIEAIEAAGTQQTNTAKEAIEAKGKETLDSIPDSYEALQEDVTQLRGDLVDASSYIPINLIDCNDFKTTTPSNWGVVSTKNTLVIEHKNTYSTGSPTMDLNLKSGEYKLNFNSNSPNVDAFMLYADGAKIADVSQHNGCFSIEDGKSYAFSIFFGTAETVTLTNIAVSVNETAIETMEDDLSELSNIVELIKNSHVKIVADFVRGGIDDGINTTQNHRVRTNDFIQFDVDKTVTCVNPEYKFSVHFYTEKNQNSWTSWSGWVTDAYLIPNGSIFRILIAKVQEQYVAADVKAFSESIAYDTDIKIIVNQLNADRNNNVIPKAYGYAGEPVNVRKNTCDVDMVYSVARPTFENYGAQGCEVYNDVLFVLHADNHVSLHNILDGSIISEYDITSGHGDGCEFSNEFYENDDEFPLLYVRGDDDKVYVNRVTRTNATLIKTIRFPSEKTGYFFGHSGDYKNNVMWTIGYNDEYYHVNEGNNYMRVCKWDMSSMTTNADGSYTPEFIEEFSLPFIITIQGQRFFNGRMWLVSSHYSNTDTKIFVVDCDKKAIVSVLSDFPINMKNYECEDIVFRWNPTTYKYDGYAIMSNLNAFRLTFN